MQTYINILSVSVAWSSCKTNLQAFYELQQHPQQDIWYAAAVNIQQASNKPNVPAKVLSKTNKRAAVLRLMVQTHH